MSSISPRDAHIGFDHGNTVLDIAGGQIVLVGVNPHQLSVHDFIFHV